MRYAVVLALLATLGCKGPKGEAGPPGAPAPAGAPVNAPDILTFEGGVVGNLMFVSVPLSTGEYSLSVYIGDAISFTELPYFLPAEGVNTYYLADTNSVDIYNAQLAGATRYRIVLVRINAAPGLSDRLEP